MVTESAHQVFEIEVAELHTWEHRAHKHNFFELVFIERGSGRQCINHHEFEYQAGNIFLLPPLDCHSFQIHEPTRFYFIRFTDHYYLQGDGLTDYQVWFDRMAFILANYNKVPGDIIASERERRYIIHTIHFIHQEYLSTNAYTEPIISGSVASILNILARSIEQKFVSDASERDSRFGEILRYINTHLTDADQLRVPILAKTFHISPTYFSEYFKKQAGISLGEYILTTKLKIAQPKILHTDLSLKEIAFQLNFTDSSHLSRSFKKVYGMTVGEFRKGGYRKVQ